jgi:hypothetical protein
MAKSHHPLSTEYQVESVDDLVELLKALTVDLDANPGAWENPTLERFLEAMTAWLETFPQAYINLNRPVPKPDWSFMADCLLAATAYE